MHASSPRPDGRFDSPPGSIGPEISLFVDLPNFGVRNMAIDEVLLDEPATPGSLRFYRWSEPTLSLGYFQPYEQREFHPASATCPVVRRASGGGAIVHDRELTYSLVLPLAHPLARNPEELYLAVHHALIEVLAGFQISAELRPRPAASPGQAEPFLCFQRKAIGDVLVDGHKIAGSAQRRRRRAILQHGSVLLETSACAPELPGIAQLTGRTISPGDVIQPWQHTLRERLGLRLAAVEAESACRRDLLHAAESQFSSSAWTRRR